MKKLLSCVAFAAISLGFSVSAFAADTLVASGGMYATSFTASGCSWASQSVSTPIGVNTTWTLRCSNLGVANYSYYNNNSGGASVQAINSNYYVTRRSGGTGANTYDYAVYKKASLSAVCPASLTKMASGPFTDLSAASYSRSMLDYNNRYYNSCPASSGCKYDIVAKQVGYEVWCK